MTMSVSELELAARRARALAIASKISSTVLGKHARSDAPSWPVSDGSSHARDGNKVKIYLPSDKAQYFVDILVASGDDKLRQMEKQSGAQLFLRGKGSNRDGNDDCPDEDLHVLVEGQSEIQVSAAERLINDLLFNKASSLSEDSQRKPGTLVLSDRLYAADIDYLPFRGSGDKSRVINVASNAVGQIIGRGGETIKMLQMKTGAFIQVSRESDPSSNMKTVTIEGTQSQVDHAEDEIMRILHENEQKDQRGHSGLGFGADTTTEIIRIPHDAVGLLIGKGGLTIKQLQMRTGCNIQVQRDCDADPSAVSRDVTLTGTDKQIEDAKREVAALVQGHGTSLDMPLEAVAPGMVVITLMIPGTCVGGVIGKQGETIKAIQQRSGARVQVSRDASMPEREITVSGSEQAVQVAKAEIENIVADNQARESGGSSGHRRTNYGDYGYDNDPYSRQAAAYGSEEYYPYSAAATVGYYMPYNYYGGYDPSTAPNFAPPPSNPAAAGSGAPGPNVQGDTEAKQLSLEHSQQHPADHAPQQPGAGASDAQMQQWQAYCMQYYSYYGQYPPEAYAGQQQSTDGPAAAAGSAAETGRGGNQETAAASSAEVPSDGHPSR